MAFLFITENFYLLVVLYEALKPITDFRSYLCTNSTDAGCIMEIIQKNQKWFTEKKPKKTDECQKPCHMMDYTYSKMTTPLGPEHENQVW